MLVVPEANCTMGALSAASLYGSLFNLSATPAANANTLDHAVGSTGPWNQGHTGTVFPGAAATDVSYAAGSYVLNLGNLASTRGVPLYRDFRVDNQTLQSLTYTARGSTTTAATATTTTDELASQIVNLQAVYGHDTSTTRDGTADTWNNSAPTTQDGWNRVVAVRIALVARSTQYEAEEVTPAHPSNCTALTAASNYPKWMPDGSTYDCLKVSTLPDYRHYRYRVFEIVVPLRNMIWQT
jgi:type IV pilus assembly protein PilW